MPANDNNGKEKDPRGRSFSLTLELIERATQFCKGGNTPAKALQIAGVSQRTAYRWLREAKAVFEDSDPDLAPDPANGSEHYLFWQLWHSLTRAEAECEALLVGKIFRAAEKDYRAALEILKRRFPERWREPDAERRRVASLTDEQLLAELEGTTHPGGTGIPPGA